MEEKVVRWGLVATMFITAAVVSLGSPSSAVANVIWGLSQYIGEVGALTLIWILFPEKRIRGLVVPLAFYYLTDMVLCSMYYIDKELYTVVNTNYSYLITLCVGVVTMIAYAVYNKKNESVVKRKFDSITP